MPPVHAYTNWNQRPADAEAELEPFRKYFFICEGANTETFYFRELIDRRKDLGIHPLVDVRLWEKTGTDKDISFAKNLVKFASEQKDLPANGFEDNDKMVIVFDGDIFEEKVCGYDELIAEIEANGDMVAVSNPGFELFLLLHIDGSYEQQIVGHETNFMRMDEKGSYSYAYNVLHDLTGMNAKKNPKIGKLAENVRVAIAQERFINQDVHNIKGKVSSKLGKIIEEIINDKPAL